MSGILAVEKKQLENILPHYKGFHLVILGNFFESGLLDYSLISHKIQLSDQMPKGIAPSNRDVIYTDYSAMPFLRDSIDLIILPHVLEFANHPVPILQETWRILIPEGYALILGFNPTSFLALKRLITRKKLEISPNKFYSPGKLRQELLKIGFNIYYFKTFHFLPFESYQTNWYRSAAFLDILGQLLWPFLGNLYLFIVKKSVAGITPIRPSWKRQNLDLKEGVIMRHKGVSLEVPAQWR